MAGERGLAEQAAQVLGKDGDSMGFSLFGEGAAHVALNGRQQEAGCGVFHGQLELLAQGGAAVRTEGGAHGQQPV
ncbi:MAG: hypothetical protein ACK2UJ_19965, partial [Candidatus Promineifilaceae bacterium]